MKRIIERIFLFTALLCALCFGANAEDSVYTITYNGTTASVSVTGAMTSTLYSEMVAAIADGCTLGLITIEEGATFTAGTNTVSADVVNNGTISGGTFDLVDNYGTISSGTYNGLYNYGTVTGGTIKSVSNYGTITGGRVYTLYNAADGVLSGTRYKDDGDWYNNLDLAGSITNYGTVNGPYDVVSGAELLVNDGTFAVRVYGNSSWGYDDGGYCWDVDYSYYAMTGFQTVGEVLGIGWHTGTGEYAYDMPLGLTNTLYKQWTIVNGVLIFKGCTNVDNVPEIPYSILADLDHIDVTMGMVKFPTVNVPVYVKNTYCASSTYYDATITGGTFNAGITFNESGKIKDSTINCSISMQKAGHLENCTYGTNAKIIIDTTLAKTSNRWGSTWPLTYDCPVEITANGYVDACTFNGPVTNYGTITTGSYVPYFNALVTNYGTISGGYFNAGVTGSGAVDAAVTVTASSLAANESVTASLGYYLQVSNAAYQWYWAENEASEGTSITNATSATLTNDLESPGYVYPVITVGSTKIEGPRVALILSGSCGDSAEWKLTGNSLAISGSGAMTDYAGPAQTPWNLYRSSLTYVTVGEGITHIGQCAFEDCETVISVSLPESLTSIGRYAFSMADSLSSINFPSKLETISNTAFEYCTALTDVTIPASLTTINENVFRYTGLKRISIPYTTTKIYSTAFDGCPSDMVVACHADSAAAVFAETNGYTAEVEAHTEDIVEGYDPTCTESGMTEGVSCSVCGFVITAQEEIPPLGHSEVIDEAVEATCTEAGLTEGVSCETCGEILTAQEEIPAAGHTEVIDEAIEATCTETGLTEGSHCETCGEILTAQEVVEKLPHTEVVVDGFAATCTEAGVSDAIFCGECGEDIQFAEEIPALGHTDSITLEAVAPTCTEAGRTAEHSCSACGELLTASETLPALGHAEVAIEAAAPTCTETGLTEGVSCETCGEILTAQEIVPALGHTVIVTPGVPPTCTESGLADGEHCETCGTVIAEQVEIPAAHTLVTDPAVEPTDYETGLTEGSHCGVCGEVIVAQEVIPANFAWDGTTITAYNGDKTEIVIPDGATALGNTVFKNNTTITSVTIPDSVTAIGTQTFFGCTSLTDVYLPENITSLSAQTFHNVSATFHVSAESATAVALSFRGVAFTTKDGYTLRYKVTSITGTPTAVYLVKYVGSATELNIPASFGGAPLTQIQMTAFADNKVIASVVIPDSVTVLGAGAFQGCDSLVSVTIPDGVAAIEDNTFAACWSLRSIDLPDNLTSIGMYAFSACPLTSIDIPDSVTTIGEAAFINNTSLTSAKLPASLTAIPNSLFENCTLLSGVTIPANVTSIGDSAFFMCESITTLIVPEGVTSIGSNAFSGCTSLSSLYLPESLTTLGSEVFSYCSSLYQIVLPDNIASVGTGMLNNMSATLYCNDGTVTAETLAAAGYSYNPILTIQEVEKADGTVDLVVTDCADFVTIIEVPEGVTKIGNWAFQSCYQLKSVSLPSTLVSIGDSAFAYCHTLESIVIPDSVHTISAGAFYDCRSLLSAVLPNSLTILNSSVFGHCESLESIVIPDGVESIGASAFINCYALACATVPECVTSIGQSAFENCTALTSVNIPENAASIGSYAFSGCTSLTSVSLPTGLTEVGKRAFNTSTIITLPELDCPTAHALGRYNVRYYVEGIPFMRFMAGTDEAGNPEIWLSDCDDAITEAIVPEGVAKVMDSAFAYKPELTRVELPQSLRAIGHYAFQGSSALESIVIPDSVTTLGSGVFTSCTALKDVTLSNSLTETGDSIFAYCTALESITIPDSVTTIGAQAFNSCSSLSSVTIPEGVVTIGQGAFLYCSALSDVTLPDSVTTIETNAFVGIANPASLHLPAGVTAIGESVFEWTTKLIVPSYDCQTAFTLSAVGYSFTLDEYTQLSFQVAADENGEAVCAVTNCDPTVTEITVPEFATVLGDYAFYSCTELKTTILHGNITSIGTNSLVGDNRVLPSFDCQTAITLSAENEHYTLAGYETLRFLTQVDENGSADVHVIWAQWDIEEAVIPEGVTGIAANVFSNCSNLMSVTLPGSLTEIGDFAFGNCPETLVIKSPADAYARTWAAENGRLWAHDVHAEETLPGIPATHLTTGLTDGLYCPECETVITAQETIPVLDLPVFTLPASLTTVEKEAFMNVPMQIVELPEGCETIGQRAFADCTQLQVALIPASVTSISDDVFAGCAAELIILTDEGSAAQAYAAENGILCVTQ